MPTARPANRFWVSLGALGCRIWTGTRAIAEVTAAGGRPASERRAASEARYRAESTFDGIATFTTAVGAVDDPVTSASRVPAVTCAFPAVTSATSLTVTFAPRAAADAVNEGSSACDPPLKPTLSL